MASDTIRVLRVLEYVGPRDVIEANFMQNAVKGSRSFGAVTIREAVVGDFPETLSQNVPNPGVNLHRS